MEDSIINISGPTPKKLRTYSSKHTVNNTVKITVNNNEFEEDLYGGGLSDYDEVDGPKAIAAHNSPPKNGAQATSFVSDL